MIIISWNNFIVWINTDLGIKQRLTSPKKKKKKKKNLTKPTNQKRDLWILFIPDVTWSESFFFVTEVHDDFVISVISIIWMIEKKIALSLNADHKYHH